MTCVLFLGGARSGKSRAAEAMARTWPGHVTYVATSQPPEAPCAEQDAEWAARVRLHRLRRPSAWRTEETIAVASLLGTATSGQLLLIDCLSLWLSRVIDQAGAWQSTTAAPWKTVDDRIDELLSALATTAATALLVSNEVGSGVVPATPSGRLYRDLLGTLNTRVAARCEEVILSVAGIAVPVKGPRAPAPHPLTLGHPLAMPTGDPGKPLTAAQAPRHPQG